jgi:hypothetical protein
MLSKVEHVPTVQTPRTQAASKSMSIPQRTPRIELRLGEESGMLSWLMNKCYLTRCKVRFRIQEHLDIECDASITSSFGVMFSQEFHETEKHPNSIETNYR